MTDLNVITLEHAGLCSCGAMLSAGEPVGFDRGRGAIVCPACLDTSAAEARAASIESSADARADQGVQTARPASQSALSATAIRAALPSSQAWLASAAGEALGRGGEPSERDPARESTREAEADEALTDALASITDSGDGLLLEERRVPGSRSTIDRLVVAGGGVFVVDAQRYAGAPVAVRRAGGLFGPKRTDLYVRGQQRNDLVRGVEKQAGAVRTVLEGMGLGEVCVSPVLCLVGGSFPRFQATLPADRATVVGPKALRKLLGRAGGLDAAARDRVYVSLAASLPAVT